MAFTTCMLKVTVHRCINGPRVSDTTLWGLVVLLDDVLRLAFWKAGELLKKDIIEMKLMSFSKSLFWCYEENWVVDRNAKMGIQHIESRITFLITNFDPCKRFPNLLSFSIFLPEVPWNSHCHVHSPHFPCSHFYFGPFAFSLSY